MEIGAKSALSLAQYARKQEFYGKGSGLGEDETINPGQVMGQALPMVAVVARQKEVACRRTKGQLLSAIAK